MKPILLIAAGALFYSLSGGAQQHPNFLIVQCENLTQRAVGAYSQTAGVTPAIDSIATRGIMFAHAYVGCPLSQPSRAGLWTGLMPHQTHIRSNEGVLFNKPVAEDVPTLGTLFSGKGYDAVHFGETHDMGALRGFKQSKDVVAYLNHPSKQPFICIADLQNPHNNCGYDTHRVDRQISQVIKALYSTPACRNTIIVVLADHGDGMDSHRNVLKPVSFYDETTNVPFIFAGPGICNLKEPVDKLLTQPTLDLLPTLCELARITVPREKQGISLVPVLHGKRQVERHTYVASEWYTEYGEIITPGRMIRSSRYKYTHCLEGNDEELYDMVNDSLEMKNLAHDPTYEKVLEAHRKMLDDYISRTNDDYRSLKVVADPR